MQPRIALVLVLAAALAASGCVGVGLTLFGVGAGVAAGTGTQYTMDGIAYRTFAAPLTEVRRATVASLKRMEVTVESDTETEEGRQMVAKAGDRTVDIELEKLTSRTTRMRVTAKHGVFFRDRSTAGEIIAQTEAALDEQTSMSQRAR